MDPFIGPLIDNAANNAFEGFIPNLVGTATGLYGAVTTFNNWYGKAKQVEKAVKSASNLVPRKAGNSTSASGQRYNKFTPRRYSRGGTNLTGYINPNFHIRSRRVNPRHRNLNMYSRPSYRRKGFRKGGRARFKGRRTGYGRRQVGLYTRGGRSPWGTIVEKKYYDKLTETQVQPNHGSWTLLGQGAAVGFSSINNIAQGTGASERLGQKIVITSIDVDFICSVPIPQVSPVFADNYGPVRVGMVLLLDKQFNGASPAAADIFTDTTEAHSPIKMENKHRFNVLKRWERVLQPATGYSTTTGQTLVHNATVLQNYKKCKIPITQSSVGADLAGIPSNNVSLWFFFRGFGGTPSGAVPGMNITGHTRIRYIDA